MEFGFRAGDRPSPDRRFTPPQAGPFHGQRPPSASPFEWEAAAALRERIIREEVERRLIEEEVLRELALARARLHGGFGPVPFTPPMPLPLVPVAVGVHPNWPPPALFGSWEGFGGPRIAGFGQPMLPNETRTRTRPLPPPKREHHLQLREIAPSASSEVLSSETKASGVKRKAHVSSATTKPTKLKNACSATTEPTELQTTAKDWSCALCQVSATSETGLNQHFEGRKHKAKLVQCGAIKVTDIKNKSGLQVTTGNNNGAGPSGAPKKIHILVDGQTHPVVQKSNYVWCERCRVSCTNAAAMTDHLRGKKHSLLNKVWRSIRAVRRNKEVKEDPSATCERKVNENGPSGIPEKHKEEDTYMTSEFSGDGSPMEMKRTTNMAKEVDANSHTVIPAEIKKEDTDTGSNINRNCAVETKQEGTGVVMDVNKNSPLIVHQKSRKKHNKNFRVKKHNKNFVLKAHQKSRKKANKKFILKVCQKSRNETYKSFLSEFQKEGTEMARDSGSE